MRHPHDCPCCKQEHYDCVRMCETDDYGRTKEKECVSCYDNCDDWNGCEKPKKPFLPRSTPPLGGE